jgi:hypothetical protein
MGECREKVVTMEGKTGSTLEVGNRKDVYSLASES